MDIKNITMELAGNVICHSQSSRSSADFVFLHVCSAFSRFLFASAIAWLKLMLSLNHSLLPSKFNNYFSLNKQVHSYATRYANDFHLPFCRTNLRKFSVSFQGPTYYNSIENDIKESNSLHVFKTKLKKNYI